MNLESLALAIGCIAERATADIATEFTRHAYGALAPDNPCHWDSDGFYTVRDACELARHGYPLPEGEHDFPVPADCPCWSAAISVGSHLVRGFLRHAWLDMPQGEPTGVVAIPVHSTAPRLHVSAGDCLLEPVAAYQRATTTLFWRIGNANPRGVLHLYCDDPVAFTPQLGRVSCTVGKPFWYG